MSAYLILACIVVLALSGGLSRLCKQRPRLALFMGLGGCALGVGLGFMALLHLLLSGRVEFCFIKWSWPGLSLHVGIDFLSAFFLLPMLVLGLLCAVYGAGYLKGRPWAQGSNWLFFNTLLASMIMVVVARNGVLFLLGWEAMALSSFFLVVAGRTQNSRYAGWVYLVASHIGAAFLLAFFVLLGEMGGSYEIGNILQTAGRLSPDLAVVALVLAFVGFGAKAGIMPMHVWLPEAHPAAPSHVSALMSGIMIKTGIYGLLRFTLALPEPFWWGWCLLCLGLLSGMLGILYALIQDDLKRLLAYCSVENIGIICIGMGLCALGRYHQVPGLVILAMSGLLLHVINHAFSKGLLFLSAGSVLHAVGSVKINRLGGLMKAMPFTGALFVMGALAICGLPPFNSFISEFLLYMAALKGILLSDSSQVITACLMSLVGLALMGGLTVACFAKSIGIAFLGEPRAPELYAKAHESAGMMLAPMLLLAALCLFLGVGAPLLQPLLKGVLMELGMDATLYLPSEIGILFKISLATMGLLAVGALLWLFRKSLLRNREVIQGRPTWDCGYIAPNPRMQYSEHSFVNPLTQLFKAVLGLKVKSEPPQELFATDSVLQVEVSDPFDRKFYIPLFRKSALVLTRLRRIQEGRVQLYVLYIVAALLFMLVWGLY